MAHREKEIDYVAWYILALIDYGTSISNLSLTQLVDMWGKILEAFKRQISNKHFFVKGELNEIDMPYFEESFKLAKIEPYQSKIGLIRSPLIGFYNQRLIIRLTIKKEAFFQIRELRDDILRDLKFVFENLKGAKVSNLISKGASEKEWKVKDIFFFPLIIVRNGAKMIELEHKNAKLNSVDPIFSIPSTSLTYTLPERGKWFSFFSFKEHYIRVSVRSVMVFCEGWIPQEFKQTLINAIYQGGIFEQVRRLRSFNKPISSQRLRVIDDDILIKLAEVIKDMIKTNIESARIAEKQRFISFFIASLSFLISAIAFLLTIINIFH